MGCKNRGGPGTGGPKAESVIVRQWEGKEERKILEFKILEMKQFGVMTRPKAQSPVLNLGSLMGG